MQPSTAWVLRCGTTATADEYHCAIADLFLLHLVALRKPPLEPCRNPVQLLQLSVTMMSGPLRLGHQQSTAHSTKNTRSDEYSPWRKDPFLSTLKVHWSRKLRGEHGRTPRKEEGGWGPARDT